MKKYLAAFFVSNIFDIVVSAIVGGVMSFVIMRVYNLDLMMISRDPSVFTNFLSTHTVIHFLMNSVGGFVSIGSGYIAAKIAKNKYLLFGLLSSTSCFIIGMLEIINSGATITKVILLILVPLLGTFGGYLYFKLQSRKVK